MPVQYSELVNEKIRLDLLDRLAFTYKQIALRNNVSVSYVQDILKTLKPAQRTYRVSLTKGRKRPSK